MMQTLTQLLHFLVGAGVSEGGQTSDMGNAQRKFPGREECSKPEEPQPRRPREDGESGARREPPARGPASDRGGEARREPDSLLPPTAASLKSRGNELFKSGQFGAAIAQYTEAIESLQSAGVHVPEELSVLYSNRAACYLKDGSCGDCIEDCHRSLELQPFSVKPLLRRAMAYESVERYRQAYVDYKTVLQIDSGIQSANDSINRITRTLMEQDGLTWREKLPPIPAVPLSAQSHRWGGTSNISSEDKQPTQISSKKAEEMFLSFKQEGNAFVKKAQYKQALEKYSACVKLNSEECSIYTNRALCYLKLGRFEEARQDCDSALHLDDSNVKAFYRRALANKGLQNYQASVDDLNKVLKMDANVTEARNELEEVTQFLKSTTNGTVTNHEKPRKKIQIQEVNEEEEVKISSKDLQHSVTTGDNNKSPAATNTRLTISKPSNAYDFGQLMNAIRAEKDRAACADLLTTVDPKDLPAFLSNKLEGDTFLIIIQSLKRYLLEKEPELVYQHLFYLSKAERFQMMLLLLSKKEKDEVQALFNALSERQCGQIILEDVQSLSRSYGL